MAPQVPLVPLLHRNSSAENNKEVFANGKIYYLPNCKIWQVWYMLEMWWISVHIAALQWESEPSMKRDSASGHTYDDIRVSLWWWWWWLHLWVLLWWWWRWLMSGLVIIVMMTAITMTHHLQWEVWKLKCDTFDGGAEGRLRSKDQILRGFIKKRKQKFQRAGRTLPNFPCIRNMITTTNPTQSQKKGTIR